MAEVLTPALAAEDVSGGSSLAVLFLVAVVLVFFGWKLLEVFFGLIFGLLGAIGMVLGALLVVIGVGALLFEGARSVEAPAPPPPRPSRRWRPAYPSGCTCSASRGSSCSSPSA
ncbi:hypothetical protein [Pseudonocardia zijingensis]|uniref:Uncharacterized protein n=1 Tax=Pseudonocardia zijingensis TaxID=153376 RepID=A0ABP3ZJR8_9PSEU